jgi:3-oxoacyl-[acyl-carrier-protein] synthase-3
MAERRTAIIGIGAYLPPKVLTNWDLEKMVDTSDEWIRTRTGIRERRIAPEGIYTSTMSVEASRQALQMAGLRPEQIDLILCCTVTPDYPFPATAALIQKDLGAWNAFGFDMQAACAGFLYGLTVADQFIRTGAARYVLVVGVELLSRVTDWQDRSTCVLFGDAAGAAVLTAAEDRGLLASRMYLDGSLWDLIYLPAGGTRMPASEKTVQERLHFLRMRGNEVFRVAVRYMGRAVREVLEDAGLTPDQVDWLVPHQANHRITQALIDYLGLPPERVYANIEYTGNTSAASIPVALAEMLEKGLLRSGQVVGLTALGAGIAYGAALLRW